MQIQKIFRNFKALNTIKNVLSCWLKCGKDVLPFKDSLSHMLQISIKFDLKTLFLVPKILILFSVTICYTSNFDGIRLEKQFSSLNPMF